MNGMGRVLALLLALLVVAGGVAALLLGALPSEVTPPEAGGADSLADWVWYAAAALIVISAAITAFHPNVIYAGLALLGAFGGVGALFVFLSADFLAITQLAVYVGGILVLILFAVMLTSRIDQVQLSNPSVALPVAGGLGALLLGLLTFVALRQPWPAEAPGEVQSTLELIGTALLQEYLLAFEVASVVLVAVLVGAVIIVRKEVRPGE